MAEWACAACTYLNADGMVSCEMCGSQRPQETQSQAQQVIPGVVENYFPKTDAELLIEKNANAKDTSDFKEVDLTGDDLGDVSALGGIMTHLDEVRRLLEKDRYIYYQPVSEVSGQFLAM
jgi:hypothetical protein